MNTHAAKISQKNKGSADNAFARKQNSKPGVQFADHRSEAVVQRKWQERVNHSPQVKQAHRWQAMADNYTARQQHPIQKKSSNTGLPNQLKTGIENLSGYAMDDVKVHYNSGKPAQLQAHAYTQGTDIHVASGQEKHLPHEAWHVVQQKQGRVKPTLQMKGKVNVNDDAGLEREADMMGAKANRASGTESVSRMKISASHSKTVNGNGAVQLVKKRPAKIHKNPKEEMIDVLDRLVSALLVNLLDTWVRHGIAEKLSSSFSFKVSAYLRNKLFKKRQGVDKYKILSTVTERKLMYEAAKEEWSTENLDAYFSIVDAKKRGYKLIDLQYIYYNYVRGGAPQELDIFAELRREFYYAMNLYGLSLNTGFKTTG